MADAIKNGAVKVNGEIVEDFRFPLNPAVDHVFVYGRQVNLKPSRTVYLMINKPQGILTTTDDERGRQTVMDMLPEKYRHLRLYPVGRLDKDSTGLVILTNDGELTYRLTHPRYEHDKEYLVQIDGTLEAVEKRKLTNGIELEDGITYPIHIKEIKAPPFNYSLTMHEGRKRQVRRMLANLGYRVMNLKRVRMGGLVLGNLRDGAVRELTDIEVKAMLTARESQHKMDQRGLKNGKWKKKNR